MKQHYFIVLQILSLCLFAPVAGMELTVHQALQEMLTVQMQTEQAIRKIKALQQKGVDLGPVNRQQHPEIIALQLLKCRLDQKESALERAVYGKTNKSKRDLLTQDEQEAKSLIDQALQLILLTPEKSALLSQKPPLTPERPSSSWTVEGIAFDAKTPTNSNPTSDLFNKRGFDLDISKGTDLSEVFGVKRLRNSNGRFAKLPRTSNPTPEN